MKSLASIFLFLLIVFSANSACEKDVLMDAPEEIFLAPEKKSSKNEKNSAQKIETIEPLWAPDLEKLLAKKLRAYEKDPNVNIAIYFKDLSQKTVFAYGEDRLVYLASGFKILILLELFRQREAGLIRFDEYLHYGWDDVRDGAPNMNRRKIGLSYSITELMQAMIRDSDNAASDLLIKKLGIYNIERSLVLEGYRDFGPLVPLIDVRMEVYTQLDARAQNLQMWQVRDVRWRNGFEPRLDLLQKHIGPPFKKYGMRELDLAYKNYYQKLRNHASLQMIGEVFENLYKGRFISRRISNEVIGILEGAYSSGHRIRGAIPEQYTIAHKTGTQHKRICDLSMVTLPDGQKFILNIAVQGLDTEAAEHIIQDLAKNIWKYSSQEHKM